MSRRFRQTPARSQSLCALIVLLFPLAGLFLVRQSLFAFFAIGNSASATYVFEPSRSDRRASSTDAWNPRFCFPPGDPVSLVLSCVRSYVTSPEVSAPLGERVVARRSKPSCLTSGGSGSYLPVDFTIPYDARATDGSNANDEIFWRLTADAVLPGLDFRATFRVPVFKTEASDAASPGRRSTPTEDRALAGSRPRTARITAGYCRRWRRAFSSGRARNKGMATALTMFGMLFIGSWRVLRNSVIGAIIHMVRRRDPAGALRRCGLASAGYSPPGSGSERPPSMP